MAIRLGIQTDGAEAKVSYLTKVMTKYADETSKTNTNVEHLRTAQTAYVKQTPQMSGQVEKLTKTMGGLSTVMQGIIAGALLRKITTDAINLDKGLIGVSKTTGITGSALADFKQEIISLSKEVPVAREELLAIAQSAGQLGITGSENILKFTKTVGLLGTASDLAGDEAATTLARMMTVAGESAEHVDILASSIVALGNNMAATESEIARVALQVGQATAEFDVSSSKAAALGAAMRAIGVQAELGGSAVGRTFRAIRDAIEEGGDAMRDLSKLTGMTGEQLKVTFKQDSVAVFEAFSKGLGTVIQQGGSASAELEKFGLRGEEILKVIPTIALRSNELGKALSIAAKETENATALTNEAETAGRSYASQIQVLQNRMTDISTVIGEKLVPVMIDLSDQFLSFTEDNKADLEEMATTVGDLASTAGDLFGKAASGYNSLPDAIQELGIIGSLFFGAKGALFLAGFSILYDWADAADTAIGRLLDGSLTFSEFAFANGEELRTMLAELEDAGARMTSQAENLRGKAARSFYSDEKEAYIKQAEELEAKISGLKYTAVQQNATRALAAYDAQLSIELQMSADYFEKRKAIEEAAFAAAVASDSDGQGKESVVKGTKSVSADTEWFDKRRLEEEKAFLDAIVKANADARDKINEKNESYHKQALKLDNIDLNQRLMDLNEEYLALEDQVEDKRALDIWYNQEKKKIDDERSKREEDLRKAQLSDWQKFYEDLLATQREEFVDQAAESMSDGFFAVITGEMDSLSEVWDTAWKGMLKIFLDTIAQMASEKIIGTAFDFAVDAIFARDGLWKVEEDGQHVIAHKDEMVVPAKIASHLRDISGERDFEGLERALSIDVDSVYDGQVHAGVIEKSQLGPFGTGMVSGIRQQIVKNAAKTATATFMGDVDLNQAMDAYFGPEALAGMLSSGIKKGVTTSLGINSIWSTFGSGAGSAATALLGGSMLGPLGILASTAMGTAGAAGMDAMADWADAREYEVFKDMMEDPVSGFGYWEGRQLAAQAIAGNLVVSKLSDEAYSKIKSALDAQDVATGMEGYAPGSFLGFMDDVFEAVGSFLDFLNPFTYLGMLFGFEDRPDYTLSMFKDEVDLVGRPVGAVTSAANPVQAALNEKLKLIHAFADSFVADVYGRSAYNAGLATAQGRAFAEITGTAQDWSNSARTSAHSSRGGGGSSYDPGGGLGGNDFGLATGGLVSTILKDAPGDQGLIAVRSHEYVMQESAVDTYGVETMNAINNGQLNLGGGGNITIQIITETGQMLQEFIVDTLKRKSENRVAVVHAKGIYGAVKNA